MADVVLAVSVLLNQTNMMTELCPAGHYCADGVRMACPRGTYRADVGGASLDDCWPCSADEVCDSEVPAAISKTKLGYSCYATFI